MVVFNPQVQQTGGVNVPDFKPTSMPDADKSSGLALANVAAGIEGGVKLAEETFQSFLKDKVEAGVNALRDTSLLAYQEIRNSQITGSAPDPTATRTAGFAGKKSLIDNNTDIPENLQAGIDRANNIGLAKAQRGSANDTLYTSQLYALTKQLRAEYPGHREFIDQQIAKISGKDPANAYMNNLLADINHAATGQDVFTKTILTKAAANLGDSEVQKWYVAAQQNLPQAMEGLTNAVFKAETQKLEQEQWKFNNAKAAGDQTQAATTNTARYEVRTQQIIDKHLNPVVDIPGLTNAATMRKLVEDSVSGKVTLDTNQRDMLVQSLSQARRMAADEMQKIAETEGYAVNIRDPKITQAIRDDKLSYFDRSIAAINDDKYGTFFEYKRRNGAMQDVTNYQVNTSPIGEWSRQRSYLQEKLGPAWMNYMDSLNLPKTGLKQLQSFFNDTQYRASVSDDVRKDGIVKSMYSDLETAKKAMKDGAKSSPKIYDDIVENVNLIVEAGKNPDPKTQEVAKEVVKYTFDPEKNAKLVSFFGRDFVDSNGQLHKGKFAMYDTLTKPKVVDSIWKLGDQDSWQKHKDWQEVSFKTLFGEEAANLSKIQGDGSIPFKLIWKDNQFIAEFPKANTNVDANYIDWARKSVNDLNKGLNNLSYMYGKEGTDPSAGVFNILMNLGYSPNDKLHGDNLPQKAIEAIAASKKPKPSPGDAYKAAE